MAEDSLAIVFSGVSKKCSADEDYPFEVNRNFYYLTGIEQDDSVLLLVNTLGERRTYLLIPPFDPVKEKWYGRRITMPEASAASGIQNVMLNSSLTAKVNSILSTMEYGSITTVYLDLERELKIAEETTTNDYRKTLQLSYPFLKIVDIYPEIVHLRMVKSPAEIEEFRKAIATTKLGIQAVMAKVKPGVYEYELANEFLHVINDDSGYQGLSFPTIMASGIHSTCLHYPTPLDKVKPGDVVLMDLGSRHDYYCADISRTVPSSGKFEGEARTIYEIVLACNKAVAKYAKPGLTLADLQAYTKEFLASECLEKGLIEKKEDITKYYFHSVSHHIGLDTHDPGDTKEKSTPLVSGNVISDEPGLYFAEKAIGVRIEDDLLITENGCEVLSSEIIKEIADIESFYASR